jgi:hypothetical protein
VMSLYVATWLIAFGFTVCSAQATERDTAQWEGVSERVVPLQDSSAITLQVRWRPGSATTMRAPAALLVSLPRVPAHYQTAIAWPPHLPSGLFKDG